MTDTWEVEEADISPQSKEYEEIEVEDFVEHVPPPAGSIYIEIIGKLINSDEDGWLTLKTGGRTKNSVQTGLLGAAKILGVKAKTKSRETDGEVKVYVKLLEDKE